jgi:hypothetical protein
MVHKKDSSRHAWGSLFIVALIQVRTPIGHTVLPQGFATRVLSLVRSFRKAPKTGTAIRKPG